MVKPLNLVYNTPFTIKEEKVEAEPAAPVPQPAPAAPTVEPGTEVTIYYNIIEREIHSSDQELPAVSASTPGTGEQVEGQVVGEVTTETPEPVVPSTPCPRHDVGPIPPTPGALQVCMNRRIFTV